MKSIFVSDEYEGMEAGTQIQGIDGVIRMFGESAFASLEEAVSAGVTNAVIRVDTDKYDYYVADAAGNISLAEQVVFVNFKGGNDLSYDNGEYSRSVDMAPAQYTQAEKADIVAALNDRNAAEGVVFTAEEPKVGSVFSTVHVGSTKSFDDLGSFKGLSETVDTNNQIKNDEAFVNTDNISSVEDVIDVIDHETGHLTGEAHEVTTGDIKDFADAAPATVYVDAAWTEESCGGHTWGVDAFNNLQDAAKAVADGGTVNVAAGTYNGNLYLDKQVGGFTAPKAIAFVGAKDDQGNSLVTYTGKVKIGGSDAEHATEYACMWDKATSFDGFIFDNSNDTASTDHFHVGACKNLSFANCTFTSNCASYKDNTVIFIKNGSDGLYSVVFDDCKFNNGYVTVYNSNSTHKFNGCTFTDAICNSQGGCADFDECSFSLYIPDGDTGARSFYCTRNSTNGSSFYITDSTMAISVDYETLQKEANAKEIAFLWTRNAGGAASGNVTANDTNFNLTIRNKPAAGTDACIAGFVNNNKNANAIVLNMPTFTGDATEASDYYNTLVASENSPVMVIYDEQGNATLVYKDSSGTVHQDPVDKTTLYANTAWTGSAAGKVVSGHVIGFNAFSSITDAVAMAKESATTEISVAKGTYADSDVDIRKSVTLTIDADGAVVNPDSDGFTFYTNSANATYAINGGKLTLASIWNGAQTGYTETLNINNEIAFGAETETAANREIWNRNGIINVNEGANVYGLDQIANRGTINIASGATVTAYSYEGSGSFELAGHSDMGGTMTLEGVLKEQDGGVWGDDKTATVANGGQTGTLSVQNGGQLNFARQTLNIGANGTVNVLTEGTITVKGMVNAGTISIDKISKITLGSFAGANGTISVDMTDADTTKEYTLIHDTDGGTNDYGTVTVTGSQYWKTKQVDGDLVAYYDLPKDILVCKESERTVVEGGYSYKGTVYKYWAGTVAAALKLADGKSCNLMIGGTGIASGTAVNPSDALIVNATTNSNVLSVTVDENAELFIGLINATSKVDISRFHGTGFIAAAGMVEIDKSAIAADFTGKIGCDSAVSSSCAFVSSIEGASYVNLNNNGATVYAYAKGLTIGNGKTLTGSEFLQINLNGTGFTQTGEVQDSGTLNIEKGAVIGTAGQKAMEVNVTDFFGYNSSPAIGLATYDGNMTGNLEINLKNSNLGRMASFVVNSVAGNYTYETNITGVADNIKYYQTSSGGTAVKNGGVYSLTLWNGRTDSEMVMNGNAVYTVKNSNAASGTMYGIYSANASNTAATTSTYNSVVNGNITVNFSDNQMINYFNALYGRAKLIGDLTLNISNSTVDGIVAFAKSGYQQGDFVINADNSSLTYTVNAMSTDGLGVRVGSSTIVFSGVDTVDNLKNFNNITISAGATVNAKYSMLSDFDTSWSNAGTLSVDMTGATADSYKLVDYKGTGTVTDYGTVALTGEGAAEYKTVVIDNDLYAARRVYVAQIGDVKYESVQEAVAVAANAGTPTTITLLSDSTQQLVKAAEAIALHNDITLTGNFTAAGTTPTNGAWDFYADGASENAYTVTIDEGTKIVMKSDTAGIGTTMTLRFGDDEPVEAGATYKNVLAVKVNGGIEADQLSFGDFSDVTMGANAEVDTKAMFQIRGNFEVDGKDGNWTADNPQFDVGTYMNVRSKTTTGRAEQRTATFKNTFITIGPSSNMADNLNLSNSGNLVLVNTGVAIANALRITDNSTVTMKDGSTVTANGHYLTGDHLSTITAGSTLNVLSGSALTVTNDITNAGTVAMDVSGSLITYGGTFTNSGTITVDMTDAVLPYYKLVDYTGSGSVTSYGTVTLTGTGAELYESKVVDGDLVIVKKETPVVVVPAQEYGTGLGSNDIYVNTNDYAEDTVAVSMSVVTGTGSVDVTNSGAGSLAVGDIEAKKDVTVTSNESSKSTAVGSISSQEDVIITHNGAGNMAVGEVEATGTSGVDTGNVTITNNSVSGDLTLEGDVSAAKVVKIINETKNTLATSGRIEAIDVIIENNKATAMSNEGTIALTKTIAAQGNIDITNGNLQKTESGIISLGGVTEADKHTAEGGLRILNEVNNVINGSGSEATSDEKAAFIEVKEEVVITNKGHINANIKTDDTIHIYNDSANTLIGSYTGSEVDVENTASGAAHDVTLTATSGNIMLANDGTIDKIVMTTEGLGRNVEIYYKGAAAPTSAITNATVNTETLYLGGESLEMVAGAVDSVFLGAYDDSVNGGAFTLTDGTVGTINGAHESAAAPAVRGSAVLNKAADQLSAVTIDNVDKVTIAKGEQSFATSGTAYYYMDEVAVAEGATLNWAFTDAQKMTYNIGTTPSVDEGLVKMTGEGTIAFKQAGEYSLGDMDVSGFTGKETVAAGSTITLKEATDYSAAGSEIDNAGTVNFEQKPVAPATAVTAAMKVTNSGEVNVDGATNFTAKVTNSGTVNVKAESTFADAANTGTVEVNADTTFTALDNDSIVNVNTANVTGEIDNDGTINVTEAATLAGSIANDGTINANKATTISATLTSEATTAGAVNVNEDTAITGDVSGYAGTYKAASGKTGAFSGTYASSFNLNGEGTFTFADKAASFDVVSDTDATILNVGNNNATLKGSTFGDVTGTAAVNTAGNAVTAEDITAGSVTADSELNASSITATGDVTANAAVTTSGDISAASLTAAAAVSGADITTTTGAIDVAAAGTLTASGKITAAGALTANGTVTASGNISAATINANAAVTATTGSISAATINANAAVTAGTTIEATTLNANAAVSAGGAVTATATNISITDGGKVAAGAVSSFGTLSVTSDTAAFATPYTLIDSVTGQTYAATLSFTVDTQSSDLTIDGAAVKFGEYFVKAYTADGDLKMANYTFAGAILVNSDWSNVEGTLVYWPTTEQHIIGGDAAKTVDDAIGYAKGDAGKKATISIVKGDKRTQTYSISQALIQKSDEITEMTLEGNQMGGTQSDAYEAVIKTGDVIGRTSDAVATTVTLKNLTVKNNAFGGSKVTSDATAAAASTLNVVGGIFAGGYVAGGSYVTGGTYDAAESTVNVSGNAQINGRIVGGAVAASGATVNAAKSSVNVDLTNAVTLRGDIYAAGAKVGTGTVNTANAVTTVTFSGAASNLTFTGRVSGGVYGQAVGTFAGSSELVFNNFAGTFKGLIQDMDTITVKGNSKLDFSRKQTLMSNTAFNFDIKGRTNNTDAMYTVNQWGWVGSDTINVSVTNELSTAVSEHTATGTYVLASGYDFSGLNYTVGGAAYTLGSVVYDAQNNIYIVTAADDMLVLNYTWCGEVMKVSGDTKEGETTAPKTIVYTDDTTGSTLSDTQKASATTLIVEAGKTVSLTNGLEVSSGVTTVNLGAGATLTTETTSLVSGDSNVIVNNDGHLDTTITGKNITLTNTSLNTLIGSYTANKVEEDTGYVTVNNTGAVSGATFNGSDIVLNNAMNSAELGYYSNVIANASSTLTINADLTGWNGVLNNSAVYSFVNSAAVTSLNITINETTDFKANLGLNVVAGADVTNTVYTVNGEVMALGDKFTIGTTEYELNTYKGDVYIFKGEAPEPTLGTLLVNAAWVDAPAFTEVEAGYYIGVNAFGKFFDAVGVAAADTNVTRIEVRSNISETIANDYAIHQDLTIGTKSGSSVVIDANANSGTWAMLSDKSASGSITVEEGVELHHIRQWIAGYFESDGASHTLNFNDKMTMSQLALWSANETAVGTVNISSTASVHMDMGDGVIDFRDGGSINVTGTLTDTTDATLNALTDADKQLYGGYVQVRPFNDNVFNLKDTCVDGVAWLKENNANSPSGKFTMNMDNAAFKTGSVNLSNVNSELNVGNGSRLLVDNGITLGANADLNVTDSEVKAASIANSGDVNVSGTSKISAASYTGKLNVGVADTATALTTDGFTQTSGKANIFGTATVTGFQLGTVQVGFETASASDDTLNLAGNNTLGNLYVGQADLDDAKEVAGWENRKYALNINGGATTLGQVYVRTTGTVNVDNAGVTTNYNCIYGAVNIINGAEYTVTGSNFYLVGRDSKKAKDKAVITVDNATLNFTGCGLEMGGGSSGYTGSGKLVLNQATVNGSMIFMEDNADGSLGTIAIESTGSSITLSGALTIGAGDSVSLDATSSITAASVTNGGTITVDMTGATADSYKLIDATAASSYGTYQFAAGKGNGYGLMVENNDLYAVKGLIVIDSTVESATGTDGNDTILVTSTGRVTDISSYALDTLKGNDIVTIKSGAYVGGLGLGLGTKDVTIEEGAQVVRLNVCGNGSGTEEKTTATIVTAGDVGNIQTSNYIDTYTLTNNGTIGVEFESPYSETSCIKLDSGSSVITNNGTINATVWADYDSWTEATPSAVTLINNGTIDNAAYLKQMYTPVGENGGFFAPLINTVQTAQRDDSLTNNGTIVGSVDLGDGNNTVTLGKGSQITAQIASEDMSYEDMSKEYNWAKGTAVTDGGVKTGSGNDTLTMNVDSVLAGAVDMGAGSDIFEITGITTLSTNIAGAKVVSGKIENCETFKVDGVDVVLDQAKQIAGAGTVTESDDVWVKLCNENGQSTISWAKSENDLTSAQTALEQLTENKIGDCVASTSANPESFEKKNNGTLA